MAKYAPVALVAALLVATALAFVYTEKLKLTLSPILGTRVDKVFAPTCDCPTGSAVISFRLRKSDRLTVEIVDRGGTAVRTLVRNDPTPRGRTAFRWDGRDDAGRVVSEGNYRPRVHLSKERRTIVLPNPIRVDVTPPQVQLESLGPRVFSPDGDGRNERVIARYRVDEPARVALFVDGVRRALKRGQKDAGRIDWYGRVDGEPLPPGRYRISLGARDVAGNVGPRTAVKSVLIRYVALGRDRVRTAAAGRFAILVLSDAAKVRWRLGERSGLATPGTLRLTAPAEPGRYTLVVSANGFVDRAAVLVRAPTP